jgi:hypothetical protein
MASKADLVALKSKYSGQINTLKEKTRQGVDIAEIGAGAAAAGYLDVAVPTVMGVPTSAAAGIALVVAGAMSDQRDISMLGIGMISGAAYKQGAALALNNASNAVDSNKKAANG